MMASGATELVGDTMAPSTKPSAQLMPSDEMRRRRHRGTGKDHAAERQQRDRAQIEAKLAPAHGDAGRIDQRRQDAVEDEFRSQHDPRQAGKQRQRNAGDHEQDRRRGA